MNKKVLIVDDNEDVCILLKKFFERSNFSAHTLKNGYELLEYLSKEKAPDAVILDLMMPGTSGVELLGSISNKWPQTKIYIFSAHSEYKEKLHAYRRYISAFVSKAEGIEKLIKTIEGDV